MNPFESYFRTEMEYLRLRGIEVSRDHPRLAPFLAGGSDPDVERLFSGFSFLSGHLKQKIEDGIPEVTNPLLSKIWPMPLRPLPATSIVQFFAELNDIGCADEYPCDIAENSHIHTSQHEPPITFITRSHLHIEPIAVQNRTMIKELDKNEITLSFRHYGSSATWSPGKIILFLSHDKSTAALLKLWFSQYLTKTYICFDEQRIRINSPIEECAPNASKLIIPAENERYWALQAFAEYLYFPHIYNFITLNLSSEYKSIPLTKDRTVSITFSFNKQLPIENIDDAFILHCCPAVNLAAKHTPEIYVPFGKKTCLLEEQNVFKVSGIHANQEPDTTNTGSNIQFVPLTSTTVPYSMPLDDSATQRYFYSIHEETQISGQHQSKIQFYLANDQLEDTQLPPLVCHYISWDPAASHLDSGKITMTGEEIPNELSVTNITPCSQGYSGITDSHQHWRLLSLLSFNYLVLKDTSHLKDLLRQFDFHQQSNLTQSEFIQRSIEGITSAVTKPMDWLVKGSPNRGVSVTLTLNPDCYANVGEMYQFAVSLSYVLSVSQNTNSFIHLDVINQRTNERWHIGHVQGHHPML